MSSTARIYISSMKVGTTYNGAPIIACPLCGWPSVVWSNKAGATYYAHRINLIKGKPKATQAQCCEVTLTIPERAVAIPTKKEMDDLRRAMRS